MSIIVVGVDGSKGSIDAVHFAIEEARLRGAEVKAVSAWHVPPAAYGTGWSIPADVDGFRTLAGETLERSLEQAGAVESGVTVTSQLEEGQPAEVLCREAADAELLVVGSRGLGGFKGLLLGSVSAQCAHHAACPVVVIPAGEEA